MKAITYILAAIGLMFLGALARDLFEPYVYVVNSEMVDSNAPEEVRAANDTLGGLPDPAMPMLSIADGMRFAAPQATVIHGTTWYELIVIATVGLFLMVLALAAVLMLKRVLHGNPAHKQDDAAVQSLYHLGKNLETRMDALETILLERQRTAN